MLQIFYFSRKKGGVNRGWAPIRPEELDIIISFLFFFFPWGSDDIRYSYYSTHRHTLSYISLLLYYIVWYYVYHLSLKMKPCPGCASDANNNRERRYVAAQSLAVIHVDRTPTTTCLSLSLSFNFPHPHLSWFWLYWTLRKLLPFVSVPFWLISRNFIKSKRRRRRLCVLMRFVSIIIIRMKKKRNKTNDAS
jgi:hypothetical protein